MVQQILWRLLGNEFLCCFSYSKCVGLREEVRHEFIVVVHLFSPNHEGLLGFSETDELDGSWSALVQELEETVLSVGSGLTEVDRRGLVVDVCSLRVHSFAIALHVELLDVGCEFAESLAVGDNGSCGIALNGCSQETDETQKQGNIFLY